MDMWWGADVSRKMDSKKIEAIREWQAPKNVSELRSFLGLANYYRRFIKARNSRTPHGLVEERPTLGMERHPPIQKLKDAVMMEPVLALPDINKPFDVETDASEPLAGF